MEESTRLWTARRARGRSRLRMYALTLALASMALLVAVLALGPAIEVEVPTDPSTNSATPDELASEASTPDHPEVEPEVPPPPASQRGSQESHPDTPDVPDASDTPDTTDTTDTTDAGSGASPAVDEPRTVTVEDPLRVWVAGDSLWELAGPALAGELEARRRASVTVDFRYSSGLTRPDFLDWPARARTPLAELDPQVVLFFVGANDSQPLIVDGVRHEPGTAAFAEAYGERTRELMTLLAAEERMVLWVGLPIMRPPEYDDRMLFLAGIHEQVAETVPGVTYVPTRELFSDDQGRYAERLTTSTGSVEVMRGGDGIHLSSAGARRLATHLVELIRTHWSVP